MKRQLLALFAFTSIAATSFVLPTVVRADPCNGQETQTGSCQVPVSVQPTEPVATVDHPSVIERYTFTYRLNSASPIVYIGTGYALPFTYTVGQVISMPVLTTRVNAIITAVDDTIPFDIQLLNSMFAVTQQYEMNNPQYIYGSGVHRSGPLLR